MAKDSPKKPSNVKIIQIIPGEFGGSIYYKINIILGLGSDFKVYWWDEKTTSWYLNN